MKRREGYKGYVIVARSHELQAGGFSAEFSVEEHDADGVMETTPRSANPGIFLQACVRMRDRKVPAANG